MHTHTCTRSYAHTRTGTQAGTHAHTNKANMQNVVYACM